MNVELRYYVPQEGSNVWFDGWVIPKYAVNTKAAAYFINFMCMPENALRNMDEIGYVSVIAAPEVLEAKIDPELAHIDLSYFFGSKADSVQVDGIQYPDKSVIERAALMRDCGSRTKNMLEMWSRVKGDNLDVRGLILVIILFTALTAWAIYNKVKAYKKNSRKRKKRRRRK